LTITREEGPLNFNQVAQRLSITVFKAKSLSERLVSEGFLKKTPYSTNVKRFDLCYKLNQNLNMAEKYAEYFDAKWIEIPKKAPKVAVSSVGTSVHQNLDLIPKATGCNPASNSGKSNALVSVETDKKEPNSTVAAKEGKRPGRPRDLEETYNDHQPDLTSQLNKLGLKEANHQNKPQSDSTTTFTQIANKPINNSPKKASNLSSKLKLKKAKTIAPAESAIPAASLPLPSLATPTQIQTNLTPYQSTQFQTQKTNLSNLPSFLSQYAISDSQSQDTNPLKASNAKEITSKKGGHEMEGGNEDNNSNSVERPSKRQRKVSVVSKPMKI